MYANSRLRPASCSSFAILFFALAACGGGGGGGGGQAIGTQDELELASPTAHTLTDDPRLVLRGTVERPTRVASVSANGIPAATSDRFAHWTIDVALGSPTTSFDVAALDASGARRSSAACTVELSPLLVAPIDLAHDPLRDQVLIADSQNVLGLVGLDVASGRMLVVSGRDRGTGPTLDDEEAVTVDAASDRAFVLENFPDQIQRVDLRSGNRAIVSDFASPGVKFDAPTDLDFDPARGRLIVANFGGDALLAVDVVNGTRSILSDATHGTGRAFDRPQHLVVVAGLDVALVLERGSDDVIAVNLANGNRSIVSGATRGSGPTLRFAKSVAFDPASGDAFVALGSALLRIDLATGDRTVAADDTHGGGPSIAGLGDVTSLPNGHAAAFVSGEHTLVSIDLPSGDRVDLDQLQVGLGERLSNVEFVTADPTTGRCFAIENDFTRFALQSIDPNGGDRTLVSSIERGSGPEITHPGGLAVVPGQGRAFVTDLVLRALLAIDLATGDRSIVSDDTTGSGVAFSDPSGVAIDDAKGLAFVNEFDSSGYRLVGVDLATGDRTELSGSNRGTGVDLILASSIAVEHSGASILVLDEIEEAIVRVDLVTGDRSFASGGGVGSGPDFFLMNVGLQLSADRTRALVVDGANGVLDVDLATGDRRVVSGPSLGRGPALARLSDASNGEASVVFGLDRSLSAIVRVDVASGDRAVVSR